MAILNTDGTPFNVSGSLQQFDPTNPEFALFNEWDQEIILMGGTPMYYYEVFIQFQTMDKLYMEDRGKMWSNTPICLYGYYDPIPSQNMMTTFGIDAPDELMFEFNYQDVLSRLGHLPKIGSRIYTPQKREHWIIIQRAVEEFKLWGEMRLQLMCQRFQESLTTSEGAVPQAVPPYSVDQPIATPAPGPTGQTTMMSGQNNSNFSVGEGL
jgi:hypothetical protein